METLQTLKHLTKPMRVPFLLLAPCCAAVGIASAYRQTGSVSGIQVLLVLVGAVSAHISVNAFNEFFDYKSGLDLRTRRTPFSGGSGMLPENPQLHRATLWLALSTFVITAMVGCYFLWIRDWRILPLGLLGLMLLITYTTWWVYHPILCLIAPGLGFGLLMVLGTHFALSGTFSPSAFTAALVPTFLVSDLLLLNQFPDAAADQSIGRRHFPVLIGPRKSSKIYGLLLLLTYVAIVGGVFLRLLPVFCLMAVATALPAWFAYRGAVRHAENFPGLISAMGINVAVTLTTPLLLAIGFLM